MCVPCAFRERSLPVPARLVTETAQTLTTDPPPLTAQLLARLRDVCGREHVLTDRMQLRTYESDGLLQYRATPGAAR